MLKVKHTFDYALPLIPVPLGCLQLVIVVFPDHNYILFLLLPLMFFKDN